MTLYRALFVLCLIPVGPLAHAQISSSYELKESALTAGGHPTSGNGLTSASFKITLDAIGEGVVRTGMSSGSFRMDASFSSAYPPPGEVLGLRWTNKTSLTWSPERSVGEYELYRNLINSLPGTFGTCFASHLTAAAGNEAATPPVGQGWFYLATARNRLNEEGTKGNRSNGTARTNTAPCP